MKNEVGKRVRGDILFEPPEPLFPDGFPKRRMPRGRGIVFLILILSAICIWAVSVSGKGRGGDEDTGGGIPESTVEDSARETYETEESEAEIEESDTHPVTEEDLSEADAMTEYEAVTENEAESIALPEPEVVGVDLSQLEKGDGYVINYSDSVADVEGLIDRGFTEIEERGDPAPLVLVIHTHTSEEYLSGGSGYRGPAGVVSVGDVLVSRLNSLGVGAVHCTVIHDTSGENAYANAAETIETMLKIYPSVKYVIDLHRLKLESDGAVLKTVSGCSDGSAQIRLTVGVQGGDLWQEDLSLAISLRQSLNGGGERVCMPVVISPGMINSSMGDYYIMVDIGSSGNTVEEAMAAGERLAFAFAEVLVE